MNPLHADTSPYFDAPRTSRSSRKAAQRNERRQSKASRESHRAPPLVGLNPNQCDYIEALRESDQVFGIGPAGAGKTYIAARTAIRKILDGEKEVLMIARPTVSKKKHGQGFLPGKLDAKLAPWMIPIMTGIKAECSQGTIDRLMAEGKIEFLSFEHMRGRSLENAVVILDEAQNCDLGDLKLFLTRIGENTQVIVCGDETQTDIPDSGLSSVLDMIDDFDVPAEVIEFSEDDVVRSPIAKAWVKAFSH